MLYHSVLLLLCLKVLSSSTTDITFKNVEIQVSTSEEQFHKTIASSNKLVDVLPDKIDSIKIVGQEIPIIYENAVTNLKDLYELAIEYCNVNEIRPGAFKNISVRWKLSLKGNKLVEVKQGVFNSLQIAALDLSENLIKHIDGGALSHMPELLHIDISNNKITNYNKNWFEDTPVLNMLSLKNNSITSLPDGAFSNLKNNKKFSDNERIINIILSFNKISSIEPKAFQDLTDIHLLLLDNNQLTGFDETLLDNVAVDMLSLELNKIKCFSGDLAKVLKAEETFMDGNPFDCKCLEEIETFAKKNEKKANFIMADLKCFSKKMAQVMEDIGKHLQDISSSEEE